MPHTITLGLGDAALALATVDDTVEGIELDGTPVVQLQQALRAPVARPLNRGNRARTLTLRVKRKALASPALAMLSLLQHEHALAGLRGPRLTMGVSTPGGGGFTIVFTHAAVAHRGRAPGTASHSDYTISAGAIELDTELLPTTTGLLMLSKGTLALDAGALSAAVVFTTPFAAAPVVSVELIAPPAAPIVGRVLSPAPTAEGFEVRFAAALPAAGYALSWSALY